LRTGDIGHVDENGYVFVTSRLKEMLIVNGYNVYPRVIEEALLTCNNVAEAAVVGVKDARKGEVPYAFVVLKTVTTQPHATTEKALLAEVKDKLYKHAIPAKIELITSLPKSPVGKVLKKDLKPSLALKL
jgi:long-chain acyl-CoA synthetase